MAEIPVDETHCQRLAKLFSVSPKDLASQLARVWQPRPSRTTASAATRGVAEGGAEALEGLCRPLLGCLAPSSDAVSHLVIEHLGSGTTLRHWRPPIVHREGRGFSGQESLVLQVAFDKVGSLKEKRAIAEPAQELFAHPEHGPAATPGWTREQNGSSKREETD